MTTRRSFPWNHTAAFFFFFIVSIILLPLCVPISAAGRTATRKISIHESAPTKEVFHLKPEYLPQKWFGSSCLLLLGKFYSAKSHTSRKVFKFHTGELNQVSRDPVRVYIRGRRPGRRPRAQCYQRVWRRGYRVSRTQTVGKIVRRRRRVIDREGSPPLGTTGTTGVTRDVRIGRARQQVWNDLFFFFFLPVYLYSPADR